MLKYVFLITVIDGVGLAQVSSGSLIGDARDPRTQPVANVSITARNNATGFSRTSATDAEGSYRIDDLLPGGYTLTARRAGFKTLAVSPISVEVDQKVRYDLELQPGSDGDTVTVTAEQTPVQTAEASEGFLLGSNVVRQLPLAGRNLIDLVTLGPGAVPRQLGGSFRHHQRFSGPPGAGVNAPVNGHGPLPASFWMAHNRTAILFIAMIAAGIGADSGRASLAPAEFTWQAAPSWTWSQSGSQSFTATRSNIFTTRPVTPRGSSRSQERPPFS